MQTWGMLCVWSARKRMHASLETEEDGIPAQLLFIQGQLFPHCYTLLLCYTLL